MLKVAIILAVAGVLPVFFVITWLSSNYHRLRILRKHCDELRAQPNSSRDDHNQAAAQYNQARNRFPANLVASLLGFKAIEPADGEQSKRRGELV
jgi:hypothetical protein